MARAAYRCSCWFPASHTTSAVGQQPATPSPWSSTRTTTTSWTARAERQGDATAMSTAAARGNQHFRHLALHHHPGTTTTTTTTKGMDSLSGKYGRGISTIPPLLLAR
ncbi:hypothetical protein GALMADRAFT_143400 [Galerina marginata CBS 339.88]|uniref:Uncharacterized protein n=1 Tax=Galerina marginata (strain CBS 339.88) TaxID=685588 RepID=A0A067SMD7_GALM3|nr:hypothetical protein GALMADRAFT_143400 [Galerina marginata CBS 339.88]